MSGCSEDVGVATSLAKVYEYYAAKSGDTTAQIAAQNILDVIRKFFADPLGYSAPESRTDYKNFNSAYNTSNYEGVFIPSSWSGKYPGGIGVNGSTNTFLSIRPWYIGDPAWSKVQAYLKRRIGTHVRLPQILGGSGRRHGVRHIRDAVPEHAAAVGLLTSQKPTEFRGSPPD